MKHVAKRISAFYADGFREMKLGKILWAIIAIKLFIMFAILKVFFFPDTTSLQSKKMIEARSPSVAPPRRSAAGEAGGKGTSPKWRAG